MNRILFEEQADRYRMDPSDSRFEHVRGVLRMREGDWFDVGLVNGPAGRACIEKLTTDAMEVRVEWGVRPPPPPPVLLLLGMCRPAAARRILGTLPTLGVRELVVFPGGKSDPAYARSSLWQSGEYHRHLFAGVEQAFDTWLPPVHLPGSTAEALDTLPKDSLRLAMDVYEGTAPLSGAVPDCSRTVCLAVGPERGWNSTDRDLLREAGFQLVHLNERILRVETAVIVGLTLVLQQMGAY